MNCPDVVRLLDDYVDRILPDEQIEAVTDHLDGCPVCRAQVDELRALIGRAGALSAEITPPHDLWPTVAKRITVRQNGLRSTWRRFARAFATLHGPLPAAIAAGAVLVIVIAGLWGPLHRRQPEELNPEVGTTDPATLTVLQALEAECTQTEQELLAYAGDEEPDDSSPLAMFATDLKIIDNAIAEARAAWTANPSCPRLVRLLTAAYRAKTALQERATRTAAGI